MLPNPASLEEDFLDALVNATTPEERLVGGWITRVEGCGDGWMAAYFEEWFTRVADKNAARAEAILQSRELSFSLFRQGFHAVQRVRSVPPPDWARDAVAMLQMVTSPSDHFLIPSLGDLFGDGLPSWLQPDMPWPLYRGFSGWMEAALAEIQDWTRGAILPFADQACHSLVHDLVRRLLFVCGRCLVLEAEKTPDLFVEQPRLTWLRLWTAKPVMARLMAIAWRQWRCSTAELIQRISTTLAPVIGMHSRVETIVAGQGDQHAGGRAVAIVSLANGERYFYKPRSDGLHRVFTELLAATQLDRDPCGIRLPIVFDCEDFQWSREVEAGDVESIPRYFWRAGALLRLLQAIGATDMHHENFVPSCDQAILVDLETILSPGVGFAAYPATSDKGCGAWLADTPGPTSFLSSPVLGRAGRCCPDLGALAGPTTMQTPYTVPALTQTSAGPRIAKSRQPLANGNALPRSKGIPVGLSGYEHDLLAGFEFAHQAILKAPNAPDSLSATQARVRFVARPTSLYSRLLQESLDPSVLSDGIARELVLERLWRSFGRCPPLLIASEQEALRELDIPTFAIPCQAADLHSDRGRVLLGAMQLSPSAELKRRWAAVAERSDHRADVEAALFAMSPEQTLPLNCTTPCSASSLSPSETALELLAACDILVKRAVVLPSGDCGWFGLDYDPARFLWRQKPLQPGLLGDAGIASALLIASTIWPEAPREWRPLGKQALLSAALRSELSQPGLDALSVAPGVLACLALAAQFTGNHEFLGAAQKLAACAIRQALRSSPMAYSIGPAAAVTIAMSHLPSGLVSFDDDLASAIVMQSSADPADEPRHRWSGALPTRHAGAAYALTILGQPLNRSHPCHEAGDAALLAGVDGVAEHFWGRHWSPEAPSSVLLDCAEVARAAERASVPGPWRQRASAAGAALVARHRSTGRWFSDLLAPDTHFLSAIHGIGAIVLLGAALLAWEQSVDGKDPTPFVPILRVLR